MFRGANPDLAARAKTASVLIIIFLLLATFGIYSSVGRSIFALSIFVLIFIACIEFCRLPGGQPKIDIVCRVSFLVLPALLITCFGLFCPFYNSQMLLAVILATVMFAQVIVLTLLCMRAGEGSLIQELLKCYARDQLGFFLLGLGGSAAIGLSFLSPAISLGLVAVVAMADSAAYFAGRAFGNRKIAPLVSPKKTLVGTVVGILSGGILGMILLCLPAQDYFLTWPSALLLSMAVVVSSQSGDYAKSIIKRLYEVKDFGAIFPGHGGALDRLDGILGAAPLALILAVMLCNR